MRRLEKLELIDRVGRELQSRMTFSEIDVYLRACGVDIRKETSGVNSKWVYVKELLADEPDDKIIEIADELDMEHGYTARRDVDTTNSKFWLSGYFRLFLSHVSAIKGKAAQLQRVLKRYGISCFVAHEDIEPTRDWQNEIEKALMSMDALAAVLSPGFKESNWTDQEVGVAIGRDILVIPVRKGIDPYGFIARYQGFQSQSQTIGQVARTIYQVIAANPKTKGRLADVLVGLLLSGKSEEDVQHWLEMLESFDGLPTRHAERIQANARENEVLMASEPLLDRLNGLLGTCGVEAVTIEVGSEGEFDDDIPF